MAINSNEVNLLQYKGTIKRCPLCGTRTPNAALDALTSGRSCKMCMGHGFVSVCLNCDGTGQYSGRTVWDGGRSEHKSTCTPCGGAGVYPTKKPADWKEESVVDPEADTADLSSTAPDTPFVPDAKNLPPPITLGATGVQLPNGTMVK